ncbi:hypothetical protein [Chryseobacterium sp. KLBC 52]|uniref:hypothetical protein n=1 Tax=Chryseobacterium sp. KLBC 52 TaxID=1862702 RepID=UPI000E0BE348|nr:hypothetical protein [Chryseobacterium sp. KLBC 52]
MRLQEFIDFDYTQFDGHVHSAIRNYIDSTMNWEIYGQLTNESEEIGMLGKQAIEKAFEQYKESHPASKNTFEFFAGKELDELVGDFKAKGVDFYVLTASAYPKVIKYLYQQNGFKNLENIPILTVSATKKEQMAIDKNKLIGKIEDEIRKENDQVFSVFLDDTAENINVFKEDKTRTEDCFLGELIGENGMNKDFINKHREFLDSTIQKYNIKPKDTSVQESKSNFIPTADIPATSGASEQLKPEDSKPVFVLNSSKLLAKRKMRNNQALTDKQTTDQPDYANQKEKAIGGENHQANNSEANNLKTGKPNLEKFMNTSNALNPQIKISPITSKANSMQKGESQNTIDSKAVRR